MINEEKKCMLCCKKKAFVGRASSKDKEKQETCMTLCYECSLCVDSMDVFECPNCGQSFAILINTTYEKGCRHCFTHFMQSYLKAVEEIIIYYCKDSYDISQKEATIAYYKACIKELTKREYYELIPAYLDKIKDLSV